MEIIAGVLSYRLHSMLCILHQNDLTKASYFGGRSMSLEERLDKIRSPRLQNQRETSVVLSAVEDTLKAQAYDRTSTAYFAALTALLSQSISEQAGISNKELASSVVYLLDVVTSFVPAPLLRNKFNQLFAYLLPCLANLEIEAALVKSAIGCLESLLAVQDNEAWTLSSSQAGPRRALCGLLTLAQDHRPKVRKRALEAITKVLQSPPLSPSLDHPAADMSAEVAMKAVSDGLVNISAQERKQRKQRTKQDDERHPGLMHALQLVRAIASASRGWPSKKIEPLCEILLQLSKSNEWLTMIAFEIFEALLSGMASSVANVKLQRLTEVIEVLRPPVSDVQLVPGWCAVLSRSFDVSAQVEPSETFQRLPEVFETVSPYCASSDYNVRVSASQCLVSLLANCVPPTVIVEPTVEDMKSSKRVARSCVDMMAAKYQTSWMEVFTIHKAALDSFKWRSSGLLDDVVKLVGELRENEAFAGKKEADDVLSRAISNMGPRNFLNILPLNLAKPKPDQPGRAWVLPLLRGSVQNTELAHFRSDFVPLSELMFQKVIDHGTKEKTMEVKIYETLVQQVWATFPGYCTFALDLPSAFDQEFAELLSNLLYQQPELRTDICNGLQTLVESYQVMVAGEYSGDEVRLHYQMTKDEGARSLNHLTTLAGNILAVLFNVYSETLPQYRGYILQCISAFLSITPEAELLQTYDRVSKLLEDSLREVSATPNKNQQNGSNGKASNTMPPTSHTLMDLVITLSIFLPRSVFSSLFVLVAKVVRIQSDPQLQKKAYKLIPRLASSEVGIEAIKGYNSELQRFLIENGDSVSSSARRDRLNAISTVVEYLPSQDLHFIPSVLSEAVMSCKEVNEKARTAAFDLLVLMARRMSAGGTVQQSRIPHMDASASAVHASLEEFFTMVAAGLAGTTPHMISASITALTRILYEFVDTLAEPAMIDLVQTMTVFLTSKSREIVHSVMGFVKVAIISLPESLMRPLLKSVIPGLLSWSHEHKEKFRLKVKKVLERAIRRFGYEEVEKHCPEKDKKLIQHIRKERERRKRKKKDAANGDEDDHENDRRHQPEFESAYDRAVFASESESSTDSDEISRRIPRRPKKTKETYITETSDEPLDLLSRKTMANIRSSIPQPAQRPQASGVRGKTGPDGKMIFDENGELVGGHDDSVDDDDDEAMALDTDGIGGIDAYTEAINGKDAVQRGQRGRLKYSNKRTDGNEMEVDSDDDRGSRRQKPKRKVRFEQSNGKAERFGQARRAGRGGPKRSLQKPKGGISKRVQRKPLGGGKINDGRIGKG